MNEVLVRRRADQDSSFVGLVGQPNAFSQLTPRHGETLVLRCPAEEQPSEDVRVARGLEAAAGLPPTAPGELEGLIVLNDLFQQGVSVKVLEGIATGEHTDR